MRTRRDKTRALIRRKVQPCSKTMPARAEAKERQALKLAEIREALVAAGYDTTARQAAVLGVCRATAWVVLNRDKRAGPSASVIKRILPSPNIPPAVRGKVEEYIQERISGLYGHCVSATRAFSNQFEPTKAKARRGCRSVAFGTVAGTGQGNLQSIGGADGLRFARRDRQTGGA